MSILNKQFSRPTAAGGDGIDLTSDGYGNVSSAYSQREDAIFSLCTPVFTLRPRHDFLQFALQFGWGLVDLLYTPNDHITLDFKLHTTVAGS